jgi:predicted TIM-barrel fold metal-dependent hydrolase
LAQDNNFKLFTIATTSDSRQEIDNMLQWAISHQQKYPNTVAYATTFSMENFGTPDWESATIALLQKDFEDGAVAVKVWKDIGMTFRNPDSTFIMIDDPRFDPIFDFIAEQGKVLVAHIGEPKNCWLPLDEMTTNNDRSYFKEHPEYHMYLHPEYPSYEDQINARDNVLAKHPNLKLVGCHLGSLEWDVDEIAKRLEKFPNFAVDTAARHGQLQVQDRDKVRQFFIDYQDRILYGTDIIARDDAGEARLTWMLETWQADWDYFATEKKLTSDKVNNEFTGLKLPASVLKKFYFENAKTWLNF